MLLPTLPTATPESVVLGLKLHFQLEFQMRIWMQRGSCQRFRFLVAVNVQNHSLEWRPFMRRHTMPKLYITWSQNIIDLAVGWRRNQLFVSERLAGG